MTSVERGSGEILKFVTCLHIVLFLKSRSIVHFCGWGARVCWVVCGRHNFMILNIQTCFDRKVTTLALVPVLY